MKCPIHKEIKVFIYTKRSSKIANQKIDVGRQCETCLVGVLNTMNSLIPNDLVAVAPDEDLEEVKKILEDLKEDFQDFVHESWGDDN